MKDKQVLLITFKNDVRELIKDKKWVERIVQDIEAGKCFIRINEYSWVSAADVQSVLFNAEPRL